MMESIIVRLPTIVIDRLQAIADKLDVDIDDVVAFELASAIVDKTVIENLDDIVRNTPVEDYCEKDLENWLQIANSQDDGSIVSIVDGKICISRS